MAVPDPAHPTDFEALSFDCYGTLIDWEAGLLAILRPWAQRQRLDVDDDGLLAAFGAAEAEAERDYPDRVYPEILATTFLALGAPLGGSVTEPDARSLGQSVRDWPAFPDSHDALVALGRRYKLIILSNVDRDSFAHSRARLDVHFDAVVTAEEVGSYKPSPANFDALLAASARLGVGPGRLLHVAQSLFHDHVPAKQAGLATVWIDRRHDRLGSGATPVPTLDISPDWEFPSMAAFAAAVEG